MFCCEAILARDAAEIQDGLEEVLFMIAAIAPGLSAPIRLAHQRLAQNNLCRVEETEKGVVFNLPA